ncbi:MAG: hypothetical protein Q9219_005202 [cf. Caloplaca sp. 3 TL-2023]
MDVWAFSLELPKLRAWMECGLSYGFSHFKDTAVGAIYFQNARRVIAAIPAGLRIKRILVCWPHEQSWVELREENFEEWVIWIQGGERRGKLRILRVELAWAAEVERVESWRERLRPLGGLLRSSPEGHDCERESEEGDPN